MKRSGIDHPKFRRLAVKLGIPFYAAIGVMECLYHFTSKHAIGGDVGKWSDEEIAEFIGWPREDASRLVEAMVFSGLLDRCTRHRLVIHDWPTHCDDSTKKTVAKYGIQWAIPEPFRNGSGPPEPKPEPEPEPKPRPLEGRNDSGSAVRKPGGESARTSSRGAPKNGQPTGQDTGQADKRAADGADPKAGKADRLRTSRSAPAPATKAGTGAGTGGIWKRVSEELLRDDAALESWLRDAQGADPPLVDRSEASPLRVFGVAERAIEVAKNPAAMFVSLVKAGDWSKTSNEQEQRAESRLRKLRAKATGPPGGSLAEELRESLKNAGTLPAYANVKHPR